MTEDHQIDGVNLEEVGIFSSKSEIAIYLILKYLLNKQEPVGSWVLKVMLELNNVMVSTATIGRFLKDMDAKEYTELVGAQGRKITPKGASYVTELSEKVRKEQLKKKILDAAHPQSHQDLLDLMRIRTVLECETARFAATRATPENIKAMERTIKRHQSSLSSNHDPTAPALDFHGKVAEASNLRFLIASLNILVHDEINLGCQLVEITRQRSADYCVHHARIAEAIKQGDPDEAEKQMRLHMEEMCADLERLLKSQLRV